MANVWHVNVSEPAQFGVGEERAHTFERNLRLAERAWACAAQGDCSSPDYRWGFVDGYTDYLNFGGSGAAPPLPPRRYWTTGYKNPAGQQAIDDWFAGFEHGAAEARESGYREVEIVPSSLLLPDGACPTAVAGIEQPPGVPAPMPELVPAPLPQPAPMP